MRPVLPALALVTALGLSGCAGKSAEVQSPPAATASTPAAVPSATSSAHSGAHSSATPSTEASTAATPAAAAAQQITLELSGGEVTGDTGRVTVELGTPVRLTITSDVADEVHVHGYDRYITLVPGEPVSEEFTADKPGVFEVETHESGTLLTRLQVS